MKYLIGIAFAFAFAFTASAATITHVEYENGQTTIQGSGDEFVQATLRINVSTGEVVEQLYSDILADGRAFKCDSVGGELGLQAGTHEVDVQLKLPANTGTYTPKFKTYGIFGGLRANNCIDTAPTGTKSFGGSLKVVADNTSSSVGVGGGDTDPFAELRELIMALTMSVTDLAKVIVTEPSQVECPPLYMGHNRVEVQSWLMTNGYASGFNSVGIYTTDQLFGDNIIWGSVSQSAYSQARNACVKG